ncbi:hypothetical protein BS47DRAFT_1334123 [Hydnum rufescens UP504]|uniref:Mitochondrial ATP synthase epsilon chain domain-containing protein n=1 Tax=Hydnum rufescens UP504 TaxID=1448309 RepID=A0A9P6AHF4_9AGAM|nr:hypothetical protein BS47DRAFT_1334123 [Hydnum rufescens UP504]
MSAYWRPFFSFNKYSQISARALRNSLKESERLAAEKRGLTGLRYQKWEGGQGGQQTWIDPPESTGSAAKSA